MKQEEFNEKFRNRSKNLAYSVIKLTSELPYSDALSVMRKQLIRSVTSTAANFRAVCRARSKREQFAKLCIVVEEADETVFWIELMNETGYLKAKEALEIKQEAMEILKVMASYKKLLSAKKKSSTTK